MSAEHYTYGRRWSHISKAWIFEDSWNAQEEAAHLEAENAQLKVELVKAVRERDELQRLYDAGKALYKKHNDEVEKLKTELAQCQQAAKFGCCEICGATSWTQAKTEGPHTARMVAGGVTTYWRCDLCWLTQREARLREALKLLLEEIEDYIRINHLSAMGNVNIVRAKQALQEGTC